MSSTGTPAPNALLIVRPFLFETSDAVAETLAARAKAAGLPEPFELWTRAPRPEDFPIGSTIVLDHPARVADHVAGFLAWIKIAVERGHSIVGPGAIDLRGGSSAMTSPTELLLLLADFQKWFRSCRVREGLHLARLRNVNIGRKAISEDLAARALETLDCVGSYRGAERELKKAGHNVSRTSLMRLDRRRKRGAA